MDRLPRELVAAVAAFLPSSGFGALVRASHATWALLLWDEPWFRAWCYYRLATLGKYPWLNPCAAPLRPLYDITRYNKYNSSGAAYTRMLQLIKRLGKTYLIFRLHANNREQLYAAGHDSLSKAIECDACLPTEDWKIPMYIHMTREGTWRASGWSPETESEIIKDFDTVDGAMDYVAHTLQWT